MNSNGNSDKNQLTIYYRTHENKPHVFSFKINLKVKKGNVKKYLYFHLYKEVMKLTCYKQNE